MSGNSCAPDCTKCDGYGGWYSGQSTNPLGWDYDRDPAYIICPNNPRREAIYALAKEVLK